MKGYVIAGIGTGIGKTLISAILTEALEADYWKPIQAGNLSNSDSDFVRKLISNKKSKLHPERYRLKKPMSPHAAAAFDHVNINLRRLELPATKNRMLIELAGGLMVPLNDKQLNIDLLKKWKLPVILVSQNYLGSINHTLLSLALLKSHGIVIKGLIFNGKKNSASENFIINYSKINCLGSVRIIKKINKDAVRKMSVSINKSLF